LRDFIDNRPSVAEALRAHLLRVLLRAQQLAADDRRRVACGSGDVRSRGPALPATIRMRAASVLEPSK